MTAPLIARVWHGVTPTPKAEAHTDYLIDREPFVLHYDVVAAP